MTTHRQPIKSRTDSRVSNVNQSYGRSKFYIAGIGIFDFFAPVILTR